MLMGTRCVALLCIYHGAGTFKKTQEKKHALGQSLD